MKKIDNIEIRRIQLDLLIQFAKFCDKNNLYYSLGYGTLIGAVRHKGYIPWDDDIDVVMPRPDYEKFLKLARNNMSNNIDVISYKFKNSAYPFLKIIDNRTVVDERAFKNIKTGVWIDIFPEDGKFENPCVDLFHCKIIYFLRQITGIKNSCFGYGSTKLKKFIKGLMYPFAKIIPNSVLCKIIDRLCSLKNFNDSRYLGNIMWGYGIKDRIEKSDFFECKDIEFEGHIFKVTSNYDKYLKNIYGNYMQLPPENKRIRHDYEAWWK